MLKKSSFIMSLFVLIAGMVIIYLLQLIPSNSKGPVITFPNEEITYKQGDPYDSLLSGVIAIDDKDGDVSNTLNVSTVTVFDNENQAHVTYVAEDKNHNVTKVRRLIGYIKTEEDVPENTAEPEKTEGPKESEIPVQTVNPEPSESPVASETPIVTDDPEPTVEPINESNATIYLTSPTVTLKKGSKFDYRKYIYSIETKTETESVDDLWKRINVIGTYNMKKAGEYKLQFYVIDSLGIRSNVEELVLVVEE